MHDAACQTWSWQHGKLLNLLTHVLRMWLILNISQTVMVCRLQLKYLHAVSKYHKCSSFYLLHYSCPFTVIFTLYFGVENGQNPSWKHFDENKSKFCLDAVCSDLGRRRTRKDSSIGPQEFVVGYSKAPEQPQSSVRPICHSHDMTSMGHEPATIRIAA